MKRFTQKFFLLAIGMILSVGASAQETIHHRFPEVKFMYNGKEYILPAWDVMFGTGDDKSKQRVQAKESWTPNTTSTIKAKIVSRFGITADEEFFTSFGGSKSAKIRLAQVDEQNNIVTDEDEKVVYSDEETVIEDLTYQQVYPNYNFSSAYNSDGDGDQKLFFPKDYTLPTDEYTITTEKVFKKVTFEIDEIGAWAYRGQKSGNFILLKAQKVIIPKEIKTIGIGAFSYIMSKEIEFEEGSTITSLAPAIFMCSDLEKITLPASLTEIRGAAFGGMRFTDYSLKTIVFKGNTAPTFKKDDKFEGNTATCDPFTAIPRLSKNNVTPARCIIEVPLGTVKQYAAVQYGENKPLTNFALSSKITLGDNGKMTYCSEEDFTVMQYNTAYTSNDDKWGEDGALKAYYVKNSYDDVDTENGKVYLTQITGESKIPGWSETEDFGVFFRGEANQSYSIFYPYDKMSTTLTMAGTTNCLKGVVTNTPITIPDPNLDENERDQYSYFIFSKSKGNFRRITTSGTCQANKAYIMIKDGGYDPSLGTEESKELTISFPEETGIATLETKSVQNGIWYTLQGIQVNQPQKGIFIKNGKKYIIK